MFEIILGYIVGISMLVAFCLLCPCVIIAAGMVWLTCVSCFVGKLIVRDTKNYILSRKCK